MFVILTNDADHPLCPKCGDFCYQDYVGGNVIWSCSSGDFEVIDNDHNC